METPIIINFLSLRSVFVAVERTALTFWMVDIFDEDISQT